MAELSLLAPTPRVRNAKVRVVALAERQWGVVKRSQLEEIGLTGGGISRWIDEGRLHRVYPGVFAVGHGCLPVEARLAAALFYAGPGAALCGVTAGFWLGILHTQPRRLHVCVPGRRASLPDVRVHEQRSFERILHRRLPVTPPAQTLLDIAGTVRFTQLRRALAEAEYLRLVTLEEVESVLGRGRPGSAALRTALQCHRPQLARTKSRSRREVHPALRAPLPYPTRRKRVGRGVAGGRGLVRAKSRGRARQPPRARHAVPAGGRPPPRPRAARRRLHDPALHLATGHIDAGGRHRGSPRSPTSARARRPARASRAPCVSGARRGRTRPPRPVAACRRRRASRSRAAVFRWVQRQEGVVEVHDHELRRRSRRRDVTSCPAAFSVASIFEAKKRSGAIAAMRASSTALPRGRR